MDFIAIAQQCAPMVDPQTMAAVAQGSNLNPLAIVLSHGHLARQPQNKVEAVGIATALANAGRDFAVGLAQIERRQLVAHHANFDQAFDACESLRIGAGILQDCFVEAQGDEPNEQRALRAALACYRGGVRVPHDVVGAVTRPGAGRREPATIPPTPLQGVLGACAASVDGTTAAALIQVESSRNPYAIGVVGGALQRQPQSLPEAVATVRSLEAAGWNYSLGLAQINKHNLSVQGLTVETAFEPCANVRAMSSILGECYERASRNATPQVALRYAMSCYYSGNFTTGFQHGYVQKVVAAGRAMTP